MDEPPARVSGQVLLIAVSFAAFVLLGLVLRDLRGGLQLSRELRGGLTEKEENQIFVLGSVVVPLAGIVASWALLKGKRLFFQDSALFFPVLSVAQAAFWIVTMRWLRALSPVVPVDVGDGIDFYPRAGTVFGAWLVMNALLLVILALTRRWRFDSPRWLEVVSGVDWVLPLLVAAALIPFASKVAIPRNLLALLVLAGLASLFHQELARFPQRRSARFAFDVLVLVAIAVVLFDAAMDADTFHYNFYLGPVAAVRGGRSMLVDVNCQYGVGVIYVIAGIFDLHLASVPATQVGFAVIVSTLAIFQKWLLYGSLRAITKSPALSALVVGVMLVSTRFMPGNYPSMYPSTGGVRFLPGFLLVGCFALRVRFPARRSMVFVLEALVVGIASIWSFESFVYVLGAYVASLGYEAVHVGHRPDLVALAKARLVPTLASIAAFHVVLAVYTRVRAGEWPHWSRYFEYIRLYSTQEFGTLPVETFTPWIVLIGAYVVTVIALGYRRVTLKKADLDPAYAVLFAMCGLGFAQFTYYVGRSHMNNQLHCSLPAFFVAGYWFIVAAEDSGKLTEGLRRSFVFCCYGAALYIVLCALPDFSKKWDHSWLGYMIAEKDWSAPRPPVKVSDAVSLMQTFAPGRRRVALFSSQDTDVDMLLRAQKTSVWPESYLTQDLLIPEARQRILTTNTGLVPGDVVFVDTGSSAPVNPEQIHLAPGVDAIDQELFSQLAAAFRFEVAESRPSGMVALRLLAR